MGGEMNQVQRYITDITDLYEYAFRRDILSFDDGFVLQKYFKRLLEFVAKQNDIDVIILRHRTELTRQELPIVATFKIDKKDAATSTNVQTGSKMVKLLLKTKRAKYCQDIENEENIEQKQKDFLLSRGLLSAIYNPIFEESNRQLGEKKLIGFVVFFKKRIDGFTPEQVHFLTLYLKDVIRVIVLLADKIYRIHEKLLREVTESRSLLTEYAISFHSLKGSLEDPSTLLQEVKSDLEKKATFQSKEDKEIIIATIECVEDDVKKIKDSILDALRTQERYVFIPDLLQLIRKAIEPLAFKLHSVDLEYPKAVGPPIGIEGKEGHLKHLFLNIMLNSYQAINEAISKEIITRGKISINIKYSLDGKWVEIYIRDNGIGIPEKNKRAIFEDGFSTWSDMGGTGRGMGLCQYIIKLHKGKLEIKSEYKNGTTVVIRLRKRISTIFCMKEDKRDGV